MGNTIAEKIERFNSDLNQFKVDVTGVRYNLDRRCLILLGHLYTEYLLVKILEANGETEKKANSKSYKNKIDTLHKKGILNKELYLDLEKLNNARNTIAHNLNIIGKLMEVDQDFVFIKTIKAKLVDAFTKLSGLL
jgi:uncharacterized protein YutE (UPF0331/DUF86 family)